MVFCPREDGALRCLKLFPPPYSCHERSASVAFSYSSFCRIALLLSSTATESSFQLLLIIFSVCFTPPRRSRMIMVVLLLTATFLLFFLLSEAPLVIPPPSSDSGFGESSQTKQERDHRLLEYSRVSDDDALLVFFCSCFLMTFFVSLFLSSFNENMKHRKRTFFHRHSSPLPYCWAPPLVLVLLKLDT